MRDPWDPPEVPATRDPWDPPEAPSAAQERPGVLEQIGTGLRRGVNIGLQSNTPGGREVAAFGQGAAGGALGMAGGALEVLPDIPGVGRDYQPGRAGAALSRTGERLAQGAREIEPVAGFTGQLAPNLIPLSAATRAATVGGGMLRGAGIGGAYGVLAPTGQEEWADRVGPKTISTILGLGLGGTLGLVGGVAGARSQRELNELEELIKSGRFETELLSEARFNLVRQAGTTATRIAELQATGKITDEQASAAIRRLGREWQPGIVEQSRAARGAQRGLENESRLLSTIAPTEAQVGQTMLNRITQFVEGLRGNKRSIADNVYGEADDAMNELYRQGRTWQSSPSGQATINNLRSRLSTDSTTQISGAERTLIEKLLTDLEGVSTRTPASTVLNAAGQPAIPAATRVAPSEPGVLREVLRRLRDAASGHPEEGFPAIGQLRAGDLANELSSSIQLWEPALARADAKYRELMELLRPTQTTRGAAVTAGERFDFTDPRIDPLRLPGMFFTSPQGVRQLTDLVGGDTAFVNNAANAYVARQLANKTPEQARAWLNSNNTRNWLPTLPQAAAQAEQTVARLEGLSQTGAQAASDTQRAVTSFRERRQAVRDEVKTAREQRETAETAARAVEAEARQGVEQLREPIQRIIRDHRDRVISNEQLPGRIRSLLTSSEGQRIPAETREALATRMNEFDRIRNVEERTRRIIKYLGGGGIVGSVLLGRDIAPLGLGSNR